MASAQLQISSLNLELDKLVDNRSALLLGMKQAEEKLSKLNDQIAEKASKKQKLERQDLGSKEAVIVGRSHLKSA